MPDSRPTKGLTFGGPAVYRVVIQGHLDVSLSDRLAGMHIETSGDWDQVPQTILVGRLRDQAQLSGVLNTLYEMHLPVLEVKKLDSEEPSQ